MPKEIYDESDDNPTMSIALSFEGVVVRLENPKDIVDSVRSWSEYTGIVSEKPQHVVNGFVAKRNIHIDFFTGPQGGKLESLERAREEIQLEADEYVFVGSSKRDEVIAEKSGWDYLDVEVAAERGDWSLKDEKENVEGKE